MRSSPKQGCFTAIAAAAFCLLTAGASFAAAPADSPSFKQDVLPILQQNCSHCHAPGQIGFQSIGLDLTNYRGVMAGSRHGQTVIPHQPSFGTLMKVLDWKKEYYTHMPAMGHQLPDKDLDTIRSWIAAGAQNN